MLALRSGLRKALALRALAPQVGDAGTRSRRAQGGRHRLLSRELTGLREVGAVCGENKVCSGRWAEPGARARGYGEVGGACGAREDGACEVGGVCGAERTVKGGGRGLWGELCSAGGRVWGG